MYPSLVLKSSDKKNENKEKSLKKFKRKEKSKI